MSLRCLSKVVWAKTPRFAPGRGTVWLVIQTFDLAEVLARFLHQLVQNHMEVLHHIFWDIVPEYPQKLHPGAVIGQGSCG